MSEVVRRRVRVTGQVQGVGYRYSCRAEAQRRRLAGWVTNCDDGAVEAVFEGPPDVVDSMIDWCRSGPRQASVAQVSVTDEQPTGGSGFRVV